MKNPKSLILNSLCAAIASGFASLASAQQAIVLQNGVTVNGQAYQGCKDTYIVDHSEASKNFGSVDSLYMAN